MKSFFRVQCLKVNCCLGTKPEGEGFRDWSFVLPEVESLLPLACVLLIT